MMRVSKIAILFLGIALGMSGFANSKVLEVSIWPQESQVPIDGIKKRLKEKTLVEDTSQVNDHPTYLVYSPKANSVRAAVIVFPGGGYQYLAIGKSSTIGLDGVDVCNWLTDLGFTCILLKYRVPNSGCHWSSSEQKHVTPDIPLALQDAQRTISMVRANAKIYEIDKNKIGVLGFSAGGNLAVLTSTAFDSRSYEPIDEADKVSCRPDFAIPVYPGHMTMEHKNKKPKGQARRELNVDIKISKEIPPTLLIHAKDDQVDPAYYSEIYEKELRKAGVKVKLILYKSGGHAFGVKKQGKDTDRWTIDAVEWLREIKIF